MRGHSAPYPPLSLLEQLEVELRFEPPAQIVARRNSLPDSPHAMKTQHVSQAGSESLREETAEIGRAHV